MKSVGANSCAFLHFPATFAEYWELLGKAQYKFIYLESTKIFATVFERAEEGPQWINTDYSRPEDSFLVGGQPVSLGDIYRKVAF